MLECYLKTAKMMLEWCLNPAGQARSSPILQTKFPHSVFVCRDILFNHLRTETWFYKKEKISNTFIWVFPGVSHPLLQTRPLGQVEKRNVMLTFSVFCNWWICFYLQYRFTITTSTNIFITPQDHYCLTANHHKKHHKHSSVTWNFFSWFLDKVPNIEQH